MDTRCSPDVKSTFNEASEQMWRCYAPICHSAVSALYSEYQPCVSALKQGYGAPPAAGAAIQRAYPAL